jgi:hypothetical protein
MASLSDTAVVHKLHFIQCYQKARTEGLSERNIRSSWKAAGLVPWNPQKVLGWSQIVRSPDPRPRLGKRPSWATELLLRAPKKSQYFYEAAQTLSGTDKLSRTSRSMF